MVKMVINLTGHAVKFIVLENEIESNLAKTFDKFTFPEFPV